MPVGSFRNGSRLHRPQQELFVSKTKINPTAILKALDRKIREQEKKENVRKDYFDAVARRTPSTPANRRSSNRKPSVPKQHKKPKGILRKSCSSEHELRYGCSDYSRYSPCAPRKGFSMYEIEAGLGGNFGSTSFSLDSKPYQRSPPKVRFGGIEKGCKKKCNQGNKGKNTGTKFSCYNNSIRFSDNPSNFTNYPEFNVSSNKAVSYDLSDVSELTSKWSDAGCRGLSNRSRSSDCKGSDELDKKIQDFSLNNIIPDKYRTNSFKFDLEPPNKYNYDIYNLDSNQFTWSSVFSNYKLKQNVPYYNPNFEKIDNLIKAPLSNLDMLINKYGSQSQHSLSNNDAHFSSSNHHGLSKRYEDAENKYPYSRDDASIQSGNDLENSAFDRSFYFGKNGQYASPTIQQPRSRQISISSSGSYGNFHNDEEVKNFSENKQISDDPNVPCSPIRQSKVATYPSSFNQSPTMHQDDVVGYLDPHEDIKNNHSENQRAESGSEYDGDRTISPTDQSSKISLDLNEANETVNESATDPFYQESPQREKETSKASSAGSSSPIVFESSSTSYEDLLNKYKTSSNTKESYSWMPQSKILKDILEDEYDGPWSRKKRFETEDHEKLPSKCGYLDRSERSEMDNVQDLINLVNGNLTEVGCSSSQQKETPTEFDMTELRRRMSKFTLKL